MRTSLLTMLALLGSLTGCAAQTSHGGDDPKGKDGAKRFVAPSEHYCRTRGDRAGHQYLYTFDVAPSLVDPTEVALSELVRVDPDGHRTHLIAAPIDLQSEGARWTHRGLDVAFTDKDDGEPSVAVKHAFDGAVIDARAANGFCGERSGPRAGATTVYESSGAVSNAQETFTVDLDPGYYTFDVNVTSVLQGAEWEDDDSQLFVFDPQGKLIAQNDDEDDSTLESLIHSLHIPRGGAYQVVVTTWDEDPVLDEYGYLVGWNDEGKSSIEFDLIVTRLTYP